MEHTKRLTFASALFAPTTDSSPTASNFNKGMSTTFYTNNTSKIGSPPLTANTNSDVR
jgi:hypothetical protein